jgi:hypothetical protein
VARKSRRKRNQRPSSYLRHIQISGSDLLIWTCFHEAGQWFWFCVAFPWIFFLFLASATDILPSIAHLTYALVLTTVRLYSYRHPVLPALVSPCLWPSSPSHLCPTSRLLATFLVHSSRHVLTLFRQVCSPIYFISHLDSFFLLFSVHFLPFVKVFVVFLALIIIGHKSLGTITGCFFFIYQLTIAIVLIDVCLLLFPFHACWTAAAFI